MTRPQGDEGRHEESSTPAPRNQGLLHISEWVRLETDRLLGWVLVVIGLLILLLGWLGVSGAAYVAQQLPYVMSAGIGGVFALGLGAALLLSADLRDEWCKLDEIHDELRRLREAGVNVPAVRTGGKTRAKVARVVEAGSDDAPATPRVRTSRRTRSAGTTSG